MEYRNRDLNNVIQFPNTENKELMQQKKRMAGLNLSIERKMSEPFWDLLNFSDEELQMLANFGETVKFSKLVASRLASNLATQILRNRQEDY